jgi:ComF family protein
MPGGVGGDIVHNLKYAGWPIVAAAMAERIARLHWPPDVVAERAGLVPVPLAKGRIRERGYNQSIQIAKELATFWRVPVHDIMRRTRTTQSQTRLTPGERLHNVAGAFEVSAPRSVVRGKHFVLVDDVVTTAATLNSCATALYDAGARIISYVTFGRARAAGDGL